MKIFDRAKNVPGIDCSISSEKKICRQIFFNCINRTTIQDTDSIVSPSFPQLRSKIACVDLYNFTVDIYSRQQGLCHINSINRRSMHHLRFQKCCFHTKKSEYSSITKVNSSVLPYSRKQCTTYNQKHDPDRKKKCPLWSENHRSFCGLRIPRPSPHFSARQHNSIKPGARARFTSIID